MTDPAPPSAVPSSPPAAGAPPARAPLAFPETPVAATARVIVDRLRAAGFVAYFVGGCVRDALLGVVPSDVDVATDAPPAAVERLFRRTFAVGEAFGVMLVRERGHTIEVATFRKESGYADRRRPSDVAYSTPEEDVKRRDFTINALFFDPVAGEVIDHVGGLHDLAARLLRTVGNPAARFEEDALRLMRAVRFAGSFQLGIEDATWRALRERTHLIAHVSRERIGEEWSKALLAAPAPFYLHFMEQSGLLERTMPELHALRELETAIGRPSLETTIGRVRRLRARLLATGLAPTPPDAALDGLVVAADDRLPILWAGLLFEIGRGIAPSHARELWESRPTMRAAVDAVPAIATRLAFSRRLREFIRARLELAPEFHHFHELPRWRRRELLGAPESAADVLLLVTYREEFELERRPLDAIAELRAEFAGAARPLLPPPLVTGRDLLAIDGVRPGPHLGRILTEVRRAQLEGDVVTREEALGLARALDPGDA